MVSHLWNFFLACLAPPMCYYNLVHIFVWERTVIGHISQTVQFWLHKEWGHLLHWDPTKFLPCHLEIFVETLQEEACPHRHLHWLCGW
ncbi:hypothetical protein CROQUDRAFT_36611 [Cronartium quercuum f. sp. fusiforme G11]|uniref:Uncharacterized protein n=1 Tax=Cronartium quercuum f. sp. fusiforme G11 TaxID=708437 RepID=A0A9P6NYB6_9BASI|nr:hypothetical protein CROQUDRAFT_36611 [Cronartium quercuum f. sp. fusiforme G11]